MSQQLGRPRDRRDKPVVCHVEPDPSIPLPRYLFPQAIAAGPWTGTPPTRNLTIQVVTECDGFPPFPFWIITIDAGNIIAIAIVNCGTTITRVVTQNFDQRIVKVQGKAFNTILNTQYVEPPMVPF